MFHFRHAAGAISAIYSDGIWSVYSSTLKLIEVTLCEYYAQV